MVKMKILMAEKTPHAAGAAVRDCGGGEETRGIPRTPLLLRLWVLLLKQGKKEEEEKIKKKKGQKQKGNKFLRQDQSDLIP